ncbi:hypothetical protein [Cedecea lapagei]|uniref:hypothetical protein n=1 Tax=Cedecea lapagei TaxID=158823 RepID=UPI001BCF52DC|nr:hypothetical protein [Cedecea lapagei]
MNTVFVIGMFKSQAKRFSAECSRRGTRCRQVLADVGKQGDFVLVPTPHDAVLSFRDWLNSENDEEYDNLHIILLPYCKITSEMEVELEIAVELGAKLIEPEAGVDGWPESLSRRNKADTTFLNTFFGKVTGLLPLVSEPEVSISDYYKQLSLENPRLVFSPHVYANCDGIASHRKIFMKFAADCLAELLLQPPGCRVDAYFRGKGIEHAQTGGISTHLEVVSEDSNVTRVKHTSQTHLKKGDNTTSTAAVRIYYHFIHHDDVSYVVIMYAGSHPEDEIHWQLQLPSRSTEVA